MVEVNGRDEPGVLWAGGLPAGLFRSDDRGASWTLNRPLWDQPGRREWFGGGYDHAGIHSIVVDPRDARHVTLGISCGGVWQTRDGGRTWAPRAILPEGEDRHLNAIASLASGNLIIAGEAGTILRSTDAGATWGKVPSSYEGSWFGVQPMTGAQVVVYGMRGRLMRSDDDGASFTEVALPVQTSLFGSALAADGRLLVAGQNGELLVSRDAAQTFTRVRVEGSPMLAAVLPLDGKAETFGEHGLHLAATN